MVFDSTNNLQSMILGLDVFSIRFQTFVFHWPRWYLFFFVRLCSISLIEWFLWCSFRGIREQVEVITKTTTEQVDPDDLH